MAHKHEISDTLGQTLTLTADDVSAGSLPSQIKAAAKRLGLQLPDGWKAEVARQFAIEWSQNDNIPGDLLDRAESLFRQIGDRLSQIPQPQVMGEPTTEE